MPRRAKNKKQKQCLAPAGAADSELPPPSPILDLPNSVLRHILAQLPLKFRLSTCSLVCSAWAAAAADATTAVVIESTYRWEQRHYDSLAAWLRKHASSATLQQLVVSGPASFCPPWQQLLGLQVLKLPKLTLPAGSMLELSRLTALTELGVHGVLCSSSQIVTRRKAKAQQQQTGRLPPRPDDASVAATVSDLARTLPRMPALVSLALGSDSARALLPALTAPAGGVNVLQQQLASLRLSKATCITPELIAALPATLTCLQLEALAPGTDQYEDVWKITNTVKISQASTPRLGQLTQLQRLDLKGIGLNGSQPDSLTGLFSALTQLTAFSINGYTAVVQAQDATGKPELAEFLSAVGSLTSGPAGLRSLEISGGFRCVHLDLDDEELWWDEDEDEEPPVPPADYAPLTAGLVSSSLTRLYLDDISLPQGCGPHMFGRPGLRLPHLAELHWIGYVQYDGGPYYVDRCLTADDVRSIFSCVEGGCLRDLTLKGVVKERNAVGWGDLSALTSLTRLSVDTSAKGVEQLTSLVALDLNRAEAQDEVWVGIAQHLTRLTYFSADNMSITAKAAKWWGVHAEYLRGVGTGVFYQLMEDEDEEEGLPVCEQLTEHLREFGIMPAPKRKRKGARR